MANDKGISRLVAIKKFFFEGQSLKDCKPQIDALTEEDKDELAIGCAEQLGEELDMSTLKTVKKAA